MKSIFVLFTSLLISVYSSSYTLVVSDLVTTGAHTWIDSSSTALAATATLCTYLKQPYIISTATSAATASISNTYTVPDGVYEIYIKVIFSGVWTNENFRIYNGANTPFVTQSLLSTSFSTTFCTLTNVQVNLFKVSFPQSYLTAGSGSSKLLKLQLSYPYVSGASFVKTIYVGPVLIYQVNADVTSTYTYLQNEQFSYFTSANQHPTPQLAYFTITSPDGSSFPGGQQIDLLTIGGSAVSFMMGGCKVWKTGTITFTQALNPHYSVKFSFYAYLFDSTASFTTSNLIITVNGAAGSVTVTSDKIKKMQAGNLFGGTTLDSIYYIEYELDHTSSPLTISIQVTESAFAGITSFSLLSANCPEYCQTCRSQGTCDLCSSTTNRDLVTCQCLESYYENLVTHTCEACDYRCQSCSYDSTLPSGHQGKCNQCRYGFDINNACTTCTNSYQYENTPKITCDNCASCCRTCTGPTDKDCLTFTKPYMIMPDNQAVLACPINYYIYTQNADRILCIQCDTSCKTCSDTATKCTACFDGYTLLFSQCLLNCPVSTYRAGLVCTNCPDPNCQDCTATQCLLCKVNNYMQRISKTCQPVCESGYYGDSTSRTCGKCHQTCVECVGPSFTQCASCSGTNNMLLIDAVNTIGMCFKTCKEGYYAANKLCVACYEGCQFCTSFNICQACVAGYYLYNENTCIQTCPSEMYPNDTVQKCFKCNAACQECFGGESYQCYSCTGGLSQYKGKCYEVCPTTTVSVSGICESCALGCDVCVGTAINDCKTCSAQKYFLNGQCYDQCPPSYQQNISNYMCEFCVTEHCDNCVSDLCKLCSSTYYYTALMCSQTCPDHTYKSDSDRQCKDCDQSCKTCTGPDIDNCLTCFNNNYFYFNNCLPVCPDGFYSDANNICHECDVSCSTCSGPATNNCITCLTASSCPIIPPAITAPASCTAYLASGSCVAVCPNKYYPSGFSQTCMPCDSSCLTCQGPSSNECLTCAVYIQRMKCVTACDVDFHLDTNQVDCLPNFPITLDCQPQCVPTQCSLVASNCGACVASRTQNKPQCTCQKGTYEIGQPDCANCLNKCATCVGTADGCTSCKGNRFGATCQCPDYYYEDGVSLDCPKCNYMCGLCTNNVCTDCADIRTNPPTCSCPDGYFDALQATCIQCEPICATCKDIAQQCLTCTGIRINPPFCTCPTKFFDFQNQCLSCPFECDDCDSSGCSTCNGNQSGPYSGKCICKNGFSRKAIGSVYCTNCDMGVPFAVYTRGLLKITVDFGGPLALVDPTHGGCDQLFLAPTFSTFGLNPTCDIDQLITITLGKGATIMVGHTFQFGVGFKLKGCAATFTTFQPTSLILQPGSTNEDNLPFITFGGLSPKSICEPVVVKFYVGNAGSRNLVQFDWAITLPQNYVNAKLTTLMSSMTPSNTFDTSLTIPKLVLTPFTFYQFTVTYGNFLSLSTSSLLYVQSLGSASVDILESAVSNPYHRYETAIINATFTYFNCTLVGAMLDTMEVLIQFGSLVLASYKEEISLSMNTEYQISQTVDPYVLAIGSNNISVSVSLPSQKLAYINYINQEISVGSLIVKVDGGNRQVGDVALVTLTASVTDQDVGPKEKDDFTYAFTWSCLDVLLGAACKDPFGKQLTYQPGKSITVSASDLAQYNSYIFQANTTKDTKTALGKTMIQVVEVDLPQLESANSTLEQVILATTYNFYDEVQLSFQYEAANPDNLMYSGTVIYDSDVKKSFKFYSLTFKFRLLDYFTDFTATQGNQITLRVSIYNPTFVMPSLRNLILTYNIPPQQCAIVSNNVGSIIELSTVVNITVTSCQDDDQPLMYKVLFYDNQTTYDSDFAVGRFLHNFVALDYQSNNQLQFMVPFVGTPDVVNCVSLLVFLIKDNKGGMSNITYPITIFQNDTIDQTSLSKLIDHQDDIPSAISTQDIIVGRLSQQANCSEIKYGILRRNDLLSHNDLPVEQQNALLNQMTKLSADDEVNHQFKLDLNFLNNFNSTQDHVYQQLKILVDSGTETLKQQEYLNNYFKHFDLFSNLISNGIYFNSTNTQTMDNIDVIKDHLIDFAIVNGDGYTLKNDKSQLVIKKASKTILNQLTSNILSEEILFRLLATQDTTNYHYYYNIFTVNPYLYEATFPINYTIGANVVYLRVVDETTQEDAIMLQPFAYTFTINETYGTNKTYCLQRVYGTWTSNDITTTLVNTTALTCKLSLFNPFTIVYNNTPDSNTTDTSNSTDTSNNTNTTNNTDSSNTNNNTNTNTNGTNINTTNTNSTSVPDELINTDPLIITQPFFLYLIVLGSLLFLFTFLAHYKDMQFAKVLQEKKTDLEIIMTNPKEDTPDIQKREDYQLNKQRTFEAAPPSIIFTNNISQCAKIKLIILNFHQLISIFYRTQGYRKVTYFVYFFRLLFIQISIFITYIYLGFQYQLVLVFVFAPLITSFYSFFLNYPFKNIGYAYLKLLIVLLSLGVIGLGIYKMTLYILDDNAYQLDQITYILIASIGYDNLIYNFLMLMILYACLLRGGSIGMKISKLMPKEDRDIVWNPQEFEFNKE